MRRLSKPVRLAILAALLALFWSGLLSFGGAGLSGSSQAVAGGPEDLERLHQRMLPLLELDGVVFTDAQETTGRLIVGVENRGLARQIEQRLTRLGIPLDLVVIQETKPIVLLETLRDKERPLRGGLQLAFSKYICTLGFNAIRNEVQGFVVASHCTDEWGSIDGTNHYQPTVAPGNHIGTEIFDVAFSKCSAYINIRKCRHSDSAFSQRDEDVTADLGFIERTGEPNTGLLDIVEVGSFQITAEASGCGVVGETQNKVGRTTGWTQGQVTNSCVHVRVAGSGKVFLNQVLVEADVGGGDSSSPVFRITGNLNQDDVPVELSGILWGGNQDGTLFVYSPIVNIELELGLITTCADFSC